MIALVADPGVKLDRETETLLDAAGFYRARGTPWNIVAERLELTEYELLALRRRHRARYEHYAAWHRNDLKWERHHAELARLRREFREADTTAKMLDAAARLQAETMRRDAAIVRKQLDEVRQKINAARAEERTANRELRQIKKSIAKAAHRQKRGQRHGGKACASRHHHEHRPRSNLRNRMARQQMPQRGAGTERHRPQRHHPPAASRREGQLQATIGRSRGRESDQTRSRHTPGRREA